jgi:hypothetical protein
MIIFDPTLWHFNEILSWAPPEYLEFSIRHKPPFSFELANLHGTRRAFVVPSKGVANNVFGKFWGLVITFRVLVAKYNSCGPDKDAGCRWGWDGSPLSSKVFPGRNRKAFWRQSAGSYSLDQHVEKGLK